MHHSAEDHGKSLLDYRLRSIQTRGVRSLYQLGGNPAQDLWDGHADEGLTRIQGPRPIGDANTHPAEQTQNIGRGCLRNHQILGHHRGATAEPATAKSDHGLFRIWCMVAGRVTCAERTAP
jgi:hypothetical protein